MSKPKTPFKLVIVMDVNLPRPRQCRGRCSERESYLCKHRFGEDVHVVAKNRLLNWPGLSDYKVTRLAFQMMRWDNPRITDETEWVIYTEDRTFWRDARAEWLQEKYRAHEYTFNFPRENVVTCRNELTGRVHRLHVETFQFVNHESGGIRFKRLVERACRMLSKAPPTWRKTMLPSKKIRKGKVTRRRSSSNKK